MAVVESVPSTASPAWNSCVASGRTSAARPSTARAVDSLSDDVCSTFCSVSIQILASVTTSRTIEIHPTMCFTRAKG